MITKQLQHEYETLLDSFEFPDTRKDLLTEEQKSFLTTLAQVKNSGITLFDLYLRKHIFISYNFPDLFGYNLGEAETIGNDYFNSRVHPDDLGDLFNYGLYTLTLLRSLPPEEVIQYKMIIDYRILGKNGNYVRVIEQHQPFGNDLTNIPRLSLSVIDLSPDQDSDNRVKCLITNYITGEHVRIPPLAKDAGNNTLLSKREKEILSLIKEGLLSKEISDKLFISVHTVNTHRQRILEKLHVQTSIEALSTASKLGIIS